MKIYLADTNIYLRFILKDNQAQFKKVDQLFKKAQKGELKIIFLSEVILEMEFVLRSVYSFSKKEITRAFLSLFKNKFLEVEEKSLWLGVLEVFQKKNLSLFDTFLFLKAKQAKAEVLSFDQDFKKLKKSK